jgi:hypothetical protein
VVAVKMWRIPQVVVPVEGGITSCGNCKKKWRIPQVVVPVDREITCCGKRKKKVENITSCGLITSIST